MSSGRATGCPLPSCAGAPPFVAITIENGSDSDTESGRSHMSTAAAALAVAAATESLKGLVKDRRDDCFRRLDGGAGIAAMLASDVKSGIRGDADDVRCRREVFGENTYPKPTAKKFWRYVLDGLWKILPIVALFGAALSIIFGTTEQGLLYRWYDGVSIIVAVFLVAAMSAVSDHSKAKRFDKLPGEADDITVAVVRGGIAVTVFRGDIVVGDVVLLKTGDVVPADGVFLEEHPLHLHVEESNSITGEPQRVTVDAKENPFLGSGVKVAGGNGRLLVTAVGTDTAWGEMMSSIVKESTDRTPLQVRLEDLTSTITKIGIAVAFLTTITIGNTLMADKRKAPLFIVVVPQGIPAAVSLALALAVNRMAKHCAMVRHLPACEAMGSVTVICTDMTGMEGPSGAKAAIETCTEVGVAVKMVTGHDISTAQAVAEMCGIKCSGDPNRIMEGRRFCAMSVERQLAIVDEIRVMAQSRPLHKLVLVLRLKEKGHVVAFTGHGANDAAALKEADVGLSMGVPGDEVAKARSHITILENNFDMVINTVLWGRCVFNNIHKFIQFHLVINFVALVVDLVAEIATGKMPLTTAQVLWVNLVMNIAGTVALAADTPTKALMQRPPVDRTAPLISNAMWRNLAAQGAFQVAALLALHLWGGHGLGVDEHGLGHVDQREHAEKASSTIVFNVFVLCQVFNMFNARDIERKNIFAGLPKNWMFLAVVAGLLGLQAVAVELLEWFVGTARLGFAQWGACVAIAAMSWPIALAVKFIPVPDKPLFMTS